MTAIIAWFKTKILASGFVRDLLSRVAKTFVQALVAQFFVSGVNLSDRVALLSTGTKALIAGGAAVASLLTGILARWSSTDKANAAFTGPATDKPPVVLGGSSTTITPAGTTTVAGTSTAP